MKTYPWRIGCKRKCQCIRKMLAESVAAFFRQLKPKERDLIKALVIDGVTERDCAELVGLSQKGVNLRKHKILEKLKKNVLKP